jgi:hypothetical protein
MKIVGLEKSTVDELDCRNEQKNSSARPFWFVIVQ